jgi:hypothetical protein
MSSTPRRYLRGVTSERRSHPLGNFPYLNPGKWTVFFDDFIHDNLTLDWELNSDGGAGTVTLVAGDGGHMKLLTDSTDTDFEQAKLARSPFGFMTIGRKALMEVRFQVTEITDIVQAFGLFKTDMDDYVTTIPTDGIWLEKTDAAASWFGKVAKGAATTTGTAVVHTQVAATWTKLGFYYDGSTSGDIAFYADGAYVTSLPNTNLPDDELLTPGIVVETGAASAETVLVDYILCAQEK